MAGARLGGWPSDTKACSRLDEARPGWSGRGRRGATRTCSSTSFNEARPKWPGRGWQEKAAHYATQAKAAWDELRFEYDADDDGTSDGRRKRAASGFVFLGGFD